MVFLNQFILIFEKFLRVIRDSFEAKTQPTKLLFLHFALMKYIFYRHFMNGLVEDLSFPIVP
jgi:hypothetical protein